MEKCYVCLELLFPTMMMGLPCKSALSYLVSPVANSVHLQDDWMRVDRGFENVGGKPTDRGEYAACDAPVLHTSQTNPQSQAKEGEWAGKQRLASPSAGDFVPWQREAHCFQNLKEQTFSMNK